jgi:exonuclease VII large subunit
MGMDEALETLVRQRQILLARLEQEREHLEALQDVATRLREQIAHDEQTLDDIESVLGKNPQLRLDEADVRLRGKRLEAVAIEVLAAERGRGNEVHYREWFELLRSSGYLVAGKEPVNTFLAQINRSRAVERVGSRTGLYRLRAAA